MRTTVTALADRLRTEADAWEFLEELRWPGGVACPKCHGSDVYLIVPKNGTSRRTSSGSMSQRRTWNCRACKRQFSATTGTMMHGTKISLRIWVLVIFEMCASKNGVAAREIERKYGLCCRSAWFLMHRIREAMKHDGLTMLGTIQADEAWIGGNPKRANKSRSHEIYKLRMIPNDAAHGGTEKTPVVSLINADTGEVRSAVVPRVDGNNLAKVISNNVDVANSVLWTDEGKWYGPIGKQFRAHQTVNHSIEEYRDWITGATVNKAENYFSQLKRSLTGTHHRVSVDHLPRYLAEFDYRYSTKHLTDGDRMAVLVGRGEGRRITYKRVAAN
jgi:transposase-like protein